MRIKVSPQTISIAGGILVVSGIIWLASNNGSHRQQSDAVRPAKSSKNIIDKTDKPKPSSIQKSSASTREQRLVKWLNANPRWSPISLDHMELRSGFGEEIGITPEAEAALSRAWENLSAKSAVIASEAPVVFDADGAHATTVPADASRSYGVYFPRNPDAWDGVKKEFADSLKLAVGDDAGLAILAHMRNALALTTGSFGEHPWMARVWIIEPTNAPRSYQFEMASGASILSLFVNSLSGLEESQRAEIMRAATTAPPANGTSFCSSIPPWLRGVVSFDVID